MNSRYFQMVLHNCSLSLSQGTNVGTILAFKFFHTH